MMRHPKLACLFLACLAVLSTSTDALAALPNGRAYEQVSPTAKNAADVIPNMQRVRASADGGGVQFASLTGFGDVRGGSVSTDYVAMRDPQTGIWSTHGITPAQEPGIITDFSVYGFEPRYMGEFSPDLEAGVFMAKSPLTDAPNVAGVVNLYLRNDLRNPGPGHYELLTDADTPQSGPPAIQPFLVAATADFSHVVFESQRNLTPEAASLPEPPPLCLLAGLGCDTTTPKLYEWVDGVTRLIGILPNGDPALSQAGQGAEAHLSYTTDVLSQDGSRTIFTAPPFDADQRGGALYVRDDHGTADTADDTTLPINTSERTDCSGDPTCGGDSIPDPNPDPNPQPATHWAASADASIVFFTSDEQLTDAPGGGLYRFDLGAPVGQRLMLLSVDEEPADTTSSAVSGVIGASQDGSYVYFTVNQNQLIAGGRTDSIGARIFVWHAGTLHEVGGIRASTELDFALGIAGWGGQPKESRVTPDGTRLVFVTRGTSELLTLYGASSEYDHGSCDGGVGCQEIYLYDATVNGGAGELKCASCNPTQAAATTNASFFVNAPEIGGSRDSSHLSHVLSDDGRFVFFNTRERLQPEDQDDAYDAYEFEVESGQSHLLSAGVGGDDSFFLDASASGGDVFLATRERLRSSDVDQSRDLYDARIGGVPDPGVEVAVPCAGDACKPPPTPRSTVQVPPTNSLVGPVDPPIRRHKKHKKRHKKHHHRRANNNRGGAK